MSKDYMSEMLEAAVQFGHKTQKWNPKMKDFIYGSKNGIHIFDLTKIKKALDEATAYLHDMASSGKTVMIVCTKPQAVDIITAVGEKLGVPYVANKWIGGLLTNFSTMKKRIRYYQKLKKEEKDGALDRYTKKEANKIAKTIVKLETTLGGVKDMTKVPDVLFVADAVRDRTAIDEANKLKIPVVAIVDSDANLDGIDYPIPGNDDSVKSLAYFIAQVEKALMAKPKK